MAFATLVNAGGTATGAGALTLSPPSGLAVDDVCWLFIESDSVDGIPVFSNEQPTFFDDWVQIFTQTETGTRLTIYRAVVIAVPVTAPALADVGNHLLTRIVAYRGVDLSNPNEPIDTLNDDYNTDPTSDTSGTFPSHSTNGAERVLIGAACGSLPDASGTGEYAVSGAFGNLANAAELTDNSTAAGTGGSLWTFSGELEDQGAVGTVSYTKLNAATKVHAWVEIISATEPPPAVDAPGKPVSLPHFMSKIPGGLHMLRKRLPIPQGIPSVPVIVNVGMAEETDTAFAVTARHDVQVGQAEETDTANPAVPRHDVQMGQALETDTAPTVTPVHQVPVGQALETDTAFSVGNQVPVGMAEETDTAFSITPTIIAPPVENKATAKEILFLMFGPGGVLKMGPPLQGVFVVAPLLVNIAQALETDTAQDITPRHEVHVGQADETDTAQTVTPRHDVQVGQASEADTAFPVAARHDVQTGQATESDTAQTIAARHVVQTGQSQEVDTAFGVTPRKQTNVGQASETDTAFGITGRKLVSVGMAIELDEAMAINPAGPILVPVGQAQELDTAFGAVPVKNVQLALASETDTAFPIALLRRVNVGQALETDEAMALVLQKRISIGQALELDEAFSLQTLKQVLVGQAVEFDTAFSIFPPEGPPIFAEITTGQIEVPGAAVAVSGSGQVELASAGRVNRNQTVG